MSIFFAQSMVKEREEDRERLRKELQKTREHLHETLAVHKPNCAETDNDHDDAALDLQQSGDLESIEVSNNTSIN